MKMTQLDCPSFNQIDQTWNCQPNLQHLGHLPIIQDMTSGQDQFTGDIPLWRPWLGLQRRQYLNKSDPMRVASNIRYGRILQRVGNLKTFEWVFRSSLVLSESAKKILRKNPVATYQILVSFRYLGDPLRARIHNTWQFYDRRLDLLKTEMAFVDDILSCHFCSISSIHQPHTIYLRPRSDVTNSYLWIYHITYVVSLHLSPP